MDHWCGLFVCLSPCLQNSSTHLRKCSRRQQLVLQNAYESYLRASCRGTRDHGHGSHQQHGLAQAQSQRQLCALCICQCSVFAFAWEVKETHGNLDGFILEDPTCLPQRTFGVLVSVRYQTARDSSLCVCVDTTFSLRWSWVTGVEE